MQSPARTLSRVAALMRRWPWYAWGGVGVGLVTLLSAGAAGATALGGMRPAGPAPVLKLGSTGPWVKYLQSLLGLPQGGVLDAATDVAVRALQKSKGLAIDGVVGPASWGALGVAPAPSSKPMGPPAPPTSTFMPGPSPASPATPPPSPVPSAGNVFGLAGGIAERDAQILQFVSTGHAEHDWWTLSWIAGGHDVKADVSRRALALSDGTDLLTVNMSFNGAQKVADVLGGAMLTTRMADEIWKQATTRLPVLAHNWDTAQPSTGTTTARMIDQSDVLAGYDRNGLVANEGKDWVLTRRFWTDPEPKKHNAANFGWYPGGSKSPGGVPVVQSIGLAHDRGFSDYSQLVRFVRRGSVVIDGVPWDLDAALADPSVSAALQDEGGTLPGSRHPDLA